MDAQRCGGVSDSLLVARIGLLNVKLFEFFERLIKHDVTIKHVIDHGFEAGAYLHRSVLNFGGETRASGTGNLRIHPFAEGAARASARATLKLLALNMVALPDGGADDTPFITARPRAVGKLRDSAS